MSQRDHPQFGKILDRFEKAWAGGTVPEIRDFLPEDYDDSIRRKLLVELVMIDLVCRWQWDSSEVDMMPPNADQLPAQPTLKDYVSHFPELGPIESLPVELIAQEDQVHRQWNAEPTTPAPSPLPRFHDKQQKLENIEKVATFLAKQYEKGSISDFPSAVNIWVAGFDDWADRNGMHYPIERENTLIQWSAYLEYGYDVLVKHTEDVPKREHSFADLVAVTYRQPDDSAAESQLSAGKIIRESFSKGLEKICDERFLTRRFSEFKRRKDPIYATLMDGMDDEDLAKTFVSYWTIGQTLAVQSRFWLEDAIFEIIRQQVTRFGQDVTHCYTQKMLSNGFRIGEKLIADIGEEELEHLQQKTWEVAMNKNALREADLIVGEQERECVDRANAKPFQRRVWTQTENADAKNKDSEYLRRMRDAIKGQEAELQKLQCSLLVVEPGIDRQPHVTAYRFINPKTFTSHDKRKQERVNLLRLYAYLCQEKPFRDPRSVRVYVTELLPRSTEDFIIRDSYPDYFSSETYLSSEEFWDRLGVPFSEVKDAISEVAKEFRKRLIDGLRKLLPSSDSSE